MTCKDCIYENKCISRISHFMDIDEATGKAITDIEKRCSDFKNKADFVEVKHGEWLKHQKLYGVGYEYVCSACEKGIRQYEGQPICSECGAKMDGRSDT